GQAATVTSVEYQGDRVAVSANFQGNDLLVMVPEAVFFNEPKSPGDAVGLAWDPGRLHRLNG
ncbi:MAG: TOBE domain-containing protein, partial [Mangrovicoccus sp.]